MSADPHPTFKRLDQPLALPLAAPHLTPDGDAYVPTGAELPTQPRAARPSIGVLFECANQYVRVYRDVGGNTYLARCPRCAKTMSFRVAPGGTPQRMFTVSCR